MSSDITSKFFDSLDDEEKLAKAKFESLDIHNTIRKIYFSSIKKASEDYAVDIENKRRYFLDTSYTEEQAQEKFNYYTENIRIKNENDNSLYRSIKNELLKGNNNLKKEDLQEIIIASLCNYINSDELNYSQKIELIERLPNQIYESNKIHRKFLFFKNLAQKDEKSNKNKVIASLYDRLLRHVEMIDCIFRCQFMEASETTFKTPLLHSKGRYLAGIYSVTSNIEMMKPQDYVDHYTTRFESANDKGLIKNELSLIHKKTTSILKFYNENLTDQSEIVRKFREKIPQDLQSKLKYSKNHRGVIVVSDMIVQHIVFELDLNDKEASWTAQEYNYPTQNITLFLFCQKLLSFIDMFNLRTKQKNKTTKSSNSDKNYSQRQVAIAYFFLGITINESNYESILKKHSNTKSNKILQKLIVKTSQLTNFRKNKTANTKHLKDLEAAKRLISGIKNKDAENSINQVISTFEANYKTHYL